MSESSSFFVSQGGDRKYTPAWLEEWVAVPADLEDKLDIFFAASKLSEAEYSELTGIIMD